MSERFFCPDLSTASVTLADAEAHHAIHVLRITVGQTLELFDGCGHSARADVQKIDRRTVTVTVTERRSTPPPNQTPLTIAAAVPKGDRLKWMVEKLTELGVDRYVPLVTQRSVVDPRPTKLEKLQATVISAAKQCRRDWLLEVAEPMRLGDMLQSAANAQSLYVAVPPDDVPPKPLQLLPVARVVLIGPEGGFTQEEVDAALAAGAQRLTWPGNILRIETAAVMAAVMLSTDQPPS